MPHLISINQDRLVQFADRQGIATTRSSTESFVGDTPGVPLLAPDEEARLVNFLPVPLE